jgi:hypothetical protein
LKIPVLYAGKVNRTGEVAMSEARQSTSKLLEMIEEGLLDRDTVIMACVNYMSEDDVSDMCDCNYFFEHEADDE